MFILRLCIDFRRFVHIFLSSIGVLDFNFIHIKSSRPPLALYFTRSFQFVVGLLAGIDWYQIPIKIINSTRRDKMAYCWVGKAVIERETGRKREQRPQRQTQRPREKKSHCEKYLAEVYAIFGSLKLKWSWLWMWIGSRNCLVSCYITRALLTSFHWSRYKNKKKKKKTIMNLWNIHGIQWLRLEIYPCTWARNTAWRLRFANNFKWEQRHIHKCSLLAKYVLNFFVFQWNNNFEVCMP